MIPEEIIHSARKVLEECKGPNGLRASAHVSANYDSYFTRDTVINVLGLSLTGHKDYLSELKVQVDQLKFLQGSAGQIASNFKVAPIKGIDVSYGTLTPKLDGPSWFVIGVCHLIKEGILGKSNYRDAVFKALAVLDALDYNANGLIYCPMGSDWADEYICEGYVLHVQLLRAWACAVAGDIYEDHGRVKQAQKIRHVIEEKFAYPGKADSRVEYLISSFTLNDRVEQFDFASNVLYAFMYPDSTLSKEIFDFIRSRFLSKGILPPAFSPEIDQNNERWDALRSFHLFEFKNQPGHYHNGGAWWIWIAWYALALEKKGLREDIQALSAMVQKFFDDQTTFDFKEYTTPDGVEGGQGKMGFTAAGLIILHEIFESNG